MLLNIRIPNVPDVFAHHDTDHSSDYRWLFADYCSKFAFQCLVTTVLKAVVIKSRIWERWLKSVSLNIPFAAVARSNKVTTTRHSFDVTWLVKPNRGIVVYWNKKKTPLRSAAISNGWQTEQGDVHSWVKKRTRAEEVYYWGKKCAQRFFYRNLALNFDSIIFQRPDNDCAIILWFYSLQLLLSHRRASLKSCLSDWKRKQFIWRILFRQHRHRYRQWIHQRPAPSGYW